MQSGIDIQQLVEVIGDAVIASDPDGAITMWNPAAEHVFGFTEREALGQSFDLIIPLRQRKSYWDGYHKAMQTGQANYVTEVLPGVAIDKDGHYLSMTFTVLLRHSADHQVTGVIAVVRDETDRYETGHFYDEHLVFAST